jgi:hypothetical protein
MADIEKIKVEYKDGEIEVCRARFCSLLITLKVGL